MTGFLIMLKGNIKLLLRNKVSIVLLILIPLVSTLILNISTSREELAEEGIVANVVVFDNSNSALSKELIELLRGSYNIILLSEVPTYIIKVPDEFKIDKIVAKNMASKISNKSNINGYLYIPEDFHNKVRIGEFQDLISIFNTGTDGRIDFLKDNVNIVLQKFSSYSKVANGNVDLFNDLIKKSNDERTKSEKLTMSLMENKLTKLEKAKITNLGYLVAIMSITIMFSGTCICSIFIKEKHNRVLKRISITKSSNLNYILVKLTLVLITLFIQTSMIMIGIKMFVKTDIGVNIVQIGLLIFGLGIIFNTLTIALSAMFENLNAINYLAFFIATTSAMLSGLYFPLEVTPSWIQNLALVMPQRWIIKTAEQLLLGKNESIALFGIIVLGYSSLFLSIGVLSLKANKE